MNFHYSFAPENFLRDKNGNVGLLFALAAIPLFVAMAAVVDYARAAKVRGELASIADAAVLSATTPAMMAQSAATATTAAQGMFAAQARTVNGLTYDPLRLTVNVLDTQQTASTQRAVSVTYRAQVQNVFGAFDSITQSNFTVSASASTTSAPNIDFYMLVDNSPSMELPATTAGVTAMISQTGCAFACHEETTNDPENTVHYSGWGVKTSPSDPNTYIDSYTYAKNNGIALRIDNVRDAVNQVAASAQSTMTYNGAAYRMAVYGFNYDFAKVQTLLDTTSANAPTIQNSVAKLVPPLMGKNNCLADYADTARTIPQSYVYPTSSSSPTTVSLGGRAANTSGSCYDSSNNLVNYSLYNNDAMTDFGNAMTRINAEMPNPGHGANQSGDTPQGVLMIVTDGVVDATVYSSSSCSTSSYVSISNSYGSFTRCMAPINPSVCTTIKNRGIRIAVLYTTYQPVETDSWYVSKIKPFISQVSTNLQACASSPTLFHEVTTGGDIKAALADLFQKAVITAPHLTN